MPCYSNTKTVLIHLAEMLKSAKTLGISVKEINENLIRLEKGREYINLQRSAVGEKWELVPYSGSGYFPRDILEPLGMTYAQTMLKKFAAKKGYTVTPGKQPGELIFTSLK